MKYRMFQIMKFALPNNENEYMIMESVKSAPAKVIHVFDLSSIDGSKNSAEDDDFAEINEFKVGRSVDTDMKIADISVSRVHSYIRIAGDRVVLMDNGSKFGTLVKVSHPEKILSLNESDERPKAAIYQIGRTMFYFKYYEDTT
mmetsp:Transcript_29898/g.45717  ORF Transcript_29898/g.45717 Transcript_29898/m.45717 type:complete len:144 (+) Transcript_29898:2708-3139(+)